MQYFLANRIKRKGAYDLELYEEDMISIILPSYNEAGNIERAYEKISELLVNQKIIYEIIYVNDGSKDNTWYEIEELSKKDNRIRGICFSRNFGKEAAILSGLAYATGECCIVMDCDLQHPPEVILEMYQLWKQGYEIIDGMKRNRGEESKFHTIAAELFYKVISRATKIDMSNASDFKLLDRKVVDTLLKLPEHHPFFRALSAWVGFKKISVEFEVQERKIGKSKWSSWALIKYAFSNITSFSTFPLQLVTAFGVLFLFFSIILGIQTLYFYRKGLALEGFTTVIILLLIMGSILMISLGIIGYYLAQIYDEVRKRPRYIVTEVTTQQENQ